MKKKLVTLCTAALFAALIFLMTAYFLHIPIPATEGYIHLGDAFIYLAACILPAPYAVCAAAIGAGLCDLMFAPVYILPTVIIKSLMVISFSRKSDKFLSRRNILASFIGGVICVGGYYLSEVILLKSFTGPLASVLFNAAQGFGSMTVFIAAAFLLDKMKAKERLDKIFL